MRADKLEYLTEMCATLGAVAVFVAVYALSVTQFGWLATVLFAWLPAGLLGWAVARGLQNAARAVFHLPPPSQWVDLYGDDALLEPVAVRSTRRADRSVRTRRDY